MSSYSGSESASNTYTETRAKYVLGKIYDDFCAIDARGFHEFIKYPNKLKGWKEDLLFMMNKNDLSFFQLQFTFGSPTKELAIQYDIKSDGSIQTDSDSGGINYYTFPKNTRINIVVQLKGNKEVSEYLKGRWHDGADFITGNEEKAGAYSKDGYGTNRKKIGTWEN